MEIDRDGEMTVEMARTLLWEHQGIEFTNEIPWYLQPQRPAPPARERSGQPGSPARGGAIRPEFLGMSAAVYQILHEEMQRGDRFRQAISSPKIPTAPTWSAPPSPSKPGSSVSRRTS